MPHVAMELRSVQISERLIIGRLAPYDETTYLVRDPSGERIRRGAFTRSIEMKSRDGVTEKKRIRLFVGHGRGDEAAVGLSRDWTDGPDGLDGEFLVKEGPRGDEALADAAGGYFGGLSVEFAPVRGGRVRADDGVVEVREAQLFGVALVGVPAYAGAEVVGVRDRARQLLDSIPPRPQIDLSPIPAPWLYDSPR